MQPYEGSWTPPETSTSSVSSPEYTQAKYPVKRKPRSRRNRNRPIHEITRLKKLIPVLETEIRVLWARADELQRHKLLARAENVELRNRVRRSFEHAQLLEAKLQLYFTTKQEVMAALLPSVGAVGRNLEIEWGKDVQVLQMLGRSVDDNYDKLQQVYEAAGLEGINHELDDAKLLPVTRESSVLQIRSVGLVPFAQKTVLRAMWKAIESQAADQCTNMGIPLGKASRVIVMKREIALRGERELSDSPVSCTIRVVLKKFVEADREIHVWDAIGEWPHAVATREYGWGVMQSMDSAGDITLVKNCIFMTSTKQLDTHPPTQMTGIKTAAPHDSFALLYKQIMHDRQRVVENALLDESRA